MSLRSGESLLHYRILDKIGEGGMGEVWRARDTTLDRDVAIKAIPPAFGSDPERLLRFEREAKVLAALSHPHIAAIHGLHEDHGRRFLAMELVQGDDLAVRISRGPLPMDDAIACARKIADALEYAHERGIIHRDLKPANIKITADGDVKVLDFGLAKAIAGDGAVQGAATSPTLIPTVTSAGTAVGVILGTAAYMSPEQARGRSVDKRADTWAFGCVLFEMITGRRAFDGETVTDVLAAIVTREPDWSLLPAAAPPAVRRLLERCLDKDPRTRLRDIGEARITLASPGAAASSGASAAGSAPSQSNRWWIPAAVVALVAGLAIGRYALAPAAATSDRNVEFDITFPGNHIETGSLALSPDGSRVVFTARNIAGERLLALRDLKDAQVRVLPGTKDAEYPFWSRDGREIAFFAGNELKRLALDGAAPRPVAAVLDPRGGSWGADDIILIGSVTAGIRSVSANGGKPPQSVTTVAKDEDGHVWPAFLPDGKRFVYLADASTDEGHRLRLGSVGSESSTILKTHVRSQPIVDPGGRLLIAERGQLMAYPFDLDRGTLVDQATLVAAPIYSLGTQHHLPASAAARGTLAFQRGSDETDLIVLDRTGRVTRTIAKAERFGNVAISPDGKRAAFEVFTDTAERLVWVLDLDRGVRTPVSHRGKAADSAAWSPENDVVYFDSNASGKWEAYRKVVAGAGEPEKLGTPGPSDVAVLNVSPDGRWLLVNGVNGASRRDLYLLSLKGKDAGTWKSWSSGPAEDAYGSFSPDSQWIAFVSDASGRPEVYVSPVEGGPAVNRWPISSGGGFEPRFSSDGSKVYYRSSSLDWTVVDVKFHAGKLEAGAPKALFTVPAIELPYLRNVMEVMPDGSGFLTIQPPALAAATSIRVRIGK